MAKCNEILKLLLQGGWIKESQKGSHIKLVHPDHDNPIIFPHHGSKEIASGTLRAIKKQAGVHYGKPKKK